MRAILDGSEDALVVYADLLQGRGDPRGELIMLQLEAERAPDDVRLAQRIRQLLDDHPAQWLRYWHGLASEWDMRRGFLSHVAAPLDVFVDTATDLAKIEPSSPDLVHLRSIELREPRLLVPVESLLDRALPLLARAQLETLTLRVPISAPWTKQLGASAAAARLATFRLRGARHYPDALTALLCGPALAQLRALELVDVDLTDEQARTLATAPHFTRLTRLHVGREKPGYGSPDQLTDAGAIALVSNLGLRELNLHGRGVTDRFVEHLGRHSRPLVRLDLGRTLLSANVGALLASLPSLEHLDVRATNFDDHSLDALLGALRRLVSLNLARTCVTDDGLAQLLQKAPRSLRDLTLTVPELDPVLLSQLQRRFTLHRWQ